MFFLNAVAFNGLNYVYDVFLLKMLLPATLRCFSLKGQSKNGFNKLNKNLSRIQEVREVAINGRD